LADLEPKAGMVLRALTSSIYPPKNENPLPPADTIEVAAILSSMPFYIPV
jgi:hypothetical protein